MSVIFGSNATATKAKKDIKLAWWNQSICNLGILKQKNALWPAINTITPIMVHKGEIGQKTSPGRKFEGGDIVWP